MSNNKSGKDLSTSYKDDLQACYHPEIKTIGDPNIYDELPTEPFKEDTVYDTGYVTCVFLSAIKNEKNVKNRTFHATNTKAIVRSLYQSTDTEKNPFILIFVIHENEFEHDIFRKAINRYYDIGDIDGIGQHKRIWYDTTWNLQSYKPDVVYTPGKMYYKEVTLLRILDLGERQALRKKYMTMKGCYEPFSEEDPTCRSRGHHAGSNYQICTRCCISTYYSRYKEGKCIEKLTPEQRRKRSIKRRGG